MDRISRIISEALEMEMKKFNKERYETYCLLSKFRDRMRRYPYDVNDDAYNTVTIQLGYNMSPLIYKFIITFSEFEVRIDKYIKTHTRRDVKFGCEYYHSENYDAKAVCEKLTNELEDIRQNKKKVSVDDKPDDTAVRTESAKFEKVRYMLYSVIKTAMQGFSQITNIRDEYGYVKGDINHLDEENKSHIIPVCFYYSKSGVLSVEVNKINQIGYSFNFDTVQKGDPYQFFVDVLQELIDNADKYWRKDTWEARDRALRAKTPYWKWKEWEDNGYC